MENLVDKSDLLYFHPCGLEIPYVLVFARNGEVSLVHGKKCSKMCFFIHCENQFVNQKHMTATVQPRLLSQELKVAFFFSNRISAMSSFLKDKKGTCPVLQSPPPPCVSDADECFMDNDCVKDKKCCSNGCYRICVPPSAKAVGSLTTGGFTLYLYLPTLLQGHATVCNYQSLWWP